MRIKGLGVAIVTPFTPKGELDLQSLESLVENQISSGVDFLVVMGTTGESVTLDPKEKQVILNAVLASASGRVPIVYGLGGNNTKALINEIKDFDFKGISAILSVSPSYNKPTQEGIFQHFKAVSEASPVPVLLYNVPGRTSSNVTAETTLRMANELPNIFGVKEASGDLNQIKEIIMKAPEGFQVFSGDDALALPVIKQGGVGVISVVGNALPKLFSELISSALNGDWVKAEELNELFDPLIPILFKEGNPAGIKALMEIQGNCYSDVRLPLVKATDSLKVELKSLLNMFETVA